jgi:hypothetical protein
MELVTVKYKGHKKKMPVTFPVGEKRLSAIEETRFADPFIQLTPSEADTLVAMDSHNFEIVVEAKPSLKTKAQHLSEAVSPHYADTLEAPREELLEGSHKRHGRKSKA